ncbi:MAG: hypothetical protein QOF48_1372, partial [Verrucomicrobiota bacterium]
RLSSNQAVDRAVDEVVGEVTVA